jgi:hypothetical protein
MEDSQKVLADNGGGFIVWGFLIILAGIGSVITTEVGYPQYAGWAWLIAVSIGWGYMLLDHRNNDKFTFGNPWIQKVITAIWSSVLFSMTILGFIGGISGTIDPMRITSVLYTVLGTAYFLQGYITGKTWVRNLGIGWWLGSIVLYFISGIYAGIVAAVMMIGLQIVPGFIFKYQLKALLKSQAE